MVRCGKSQHVLNYFYHRFRLIKVYPMTAVERQDVFAIRSNRLDGHSLNGAFCLELRVGRCSHVFNQLSTLG